MSKDTSGGVEQAGTAPGTVVQENDAGLVDAGPYPYPEAGRAGDRAGQPHPGPPAPGPGTAFGPARRQRSKTRLGPASTACHSRSMPYSPLLKRNSTRAAASGLRLERGVRYSGDRNLRDAKPWSLPQRTSPGAGPGTRRAPAHRACASAAGDGEVRGPGGVRGGSGRWCRGAPQRRPSRRRPPGSAPVRPSSRPAPARSARRSGAARRFLSMIAKNLRPSSLTPRVGHDPRSPSPIPCAVGGVAQLIGALEVGSCVATW